MENLKKLCPQIRRDILRMVHLNASGHVGGSLGCTEYFVALYFKIMEISDKFDMHGKNEDLFFLSNGHLSAVWYSVLARKNFFDIKELSTFRSINSRLQGHPATEKSLPGIRIASGSLGQGLSVAIGSAQSKKLNNDNKTVFVLMGDGELQEGQIWEAAMYASHNKIDNIIATVDYNNKQIDGDINDVLSLGNLEEKWKAFGWEVIIENNGNDIDSVVNTLQKAKNKLGNEKPIIILLKTKMGYGVDFMEDSHKWHGSAPNDEQLSIALKQLEETLGDY